MRENKEQETPEAPLNELEIEFVRKLISTLRCHCGRDYARCLVEAGSCGTHVLNFNYGVRVRPEETTNNG